LAELAPGSNHELKREVDARGGLKVDLPTSSVAHVDDRGVEHPIYAALSLAKGDRILHLNLGHIILFR